MKVTSYIIGKVTYDGQFFWIQHSDHKKIFDEMSGWGRVTGKFQDELGEWIAEAINEKRERELNNPKK